MAPAPIIGITTYHREGKEREAFSLPTAYVDAVRAVGAVPVLLPPGQADPSALLEAVDGVLFGGGGDLDPALCGGEASGHNYSVSRERDEFELALARAALERRTPLLAICRGMQVLNQARGGTLHAHLPDVVGETVRHRTSQTQHVGHPVALTPDSHLARVYGASQLEEIASWHHQGVAELGQGFEVVARAPDGTIEALERPGHPECLAVQWHPELQIEPGSPQLRLFRSFARRAAGENPE